MALTLDASNITTISTAESTSGWSGPTMATENEILKEGTYSLSSIVRNDGQEEYYSVSNQDYSSQHLRLWVSTGVYGLFDVSGKTGLRFYVNDGSNTAFWNIADKTTYQGGWLNIVVDTDAPDSGSATMTSIDEVGIIFGLTGSAKRVVNTYVDYLRYGDGYTGYGTSWSLADTVIADVAGGFGIINLYEDIYFLTGNFQIGRNSEQTTYTEDGSVISFVDAPVNSTLFGITLIGYSTSIFSFTNCVFTAAGTQNYYLDFDDAGITDLTFNGNTISKASTINFLGNLSNIEVLGNVFSGCGIIYPKGCDFQNNTITDTTVTGTDGSIYLADGTTITNSKNLVFNNYAGKYAIHIPASVTGTITLNNFIGDGSGTDVYWAATSGELTINKSNGTNFSTWSAGGSATVSLVSSVSININVKDQSGTNMTGALVYVDEDLDSAGNIVNTTTDGSGNISTSYSGAAASATVRVRKYGYKQNVGSISLTADSQTNVIMITDPQQT